MSGCISVFTIVSGKPKDTDHSLFADHHLIVGAMKKGDHLFLVDGSGYIFRAYHALPPLTRKSDGLPVGAVSGFCNMLWKLLREARDTSVRDTPTHFAVIFDYSSHTFRKEIYPEYKANRSAPPEDLIPQFGLIRQATKAFNLPCIEKEGYEADDLIATYARMAEEAGAEVTIISSDKDLMQLVTPMVSMYDSMKDKQIGIADVIEKWGVPPEKMIDLQAMTGDSTDNVPGIPGIGPKTAAQLLEEFGDLDTLLARAGEIKQQKRRENIIQYAEQARISRQLVTLKKDTPVDVGIEDFSLEPQNGPKLVAFLKAMEFNALTRRAAEATGVDASEIEPANVRIQAVAEAHGPDLDIASGRRPSQPAKTAPQSGSRPRPSQLLANVEATPADLVKSRTDEVLAAKFDRSAYATIRDVAALQVWIDEAMASGVIAFDTETDSADPMQTEVVGLSLATRPGRAAYIPINHISGDGDLLGGGPVEHQIPEREVFRMLKPLLEDAIGPQDRAQHEI